MPYSTPGPVGQRWVPPFVSGRIWFHLSLLDGNTGYLSGDVSVEATALFTFLSAKIFHALKPKSD